MTSTPIVFFSGAEIDNVTTSGSVSEDTTAGHFDSTYSRLGLYANDTTGFYDAFFYDISGVLTSYAVVSGDTLWFTFYYYSFRIPNTNIIQIRDTSGNPWISFGSLTANVFAAYVNTNTGASPTWTQIGSTFSPNSNVQYVVQVQFGSPHTVTVYQNGSQVTSGTATSANLLTATLNRFRHSGVFYPGLGSDGSVLSQICVALNIGLVNAKIKATVASGAGSSSGWTGAYTDINETTFNVATVNTTTTALADQSYAWGDITIPSGYSVRDVFHFFRAKNDGTSPLNIKPLYKPSGSSFVVGSNLPNVGVGYSPSLIRYTTDPNTGLAWTQAGYNAAEFGMRSDS